MVRHNMNKKMILAMIYAATVAFAPFVSTAATADALPSAAYFRSRPAKPEIDSGVFARDAARDLGEVDRIVKAPKGKTHRFRTVLRPVK